MFLSDYHQPISDLPEGVWVGQFDRLDELNQRLTDRTTSNNQGKPNFDTRSVPTRNINVFPILNARKSSEISIKSSTSSIDTDVESQLRNQCYTLQHGAPQGVYIPSSQSDLYQRSGTEKDRSSSGSNASTSLTTSSPIPAPHENITPKVPPVLNRPPLVFNSQTRVPKGY